MTPFAYDGYRMTPCGGHQPSPCGEAGTFPRTGRDQAAVGIRNQQDILYSYQVRGATTKDESTKSLHGSVTARH